MNAMLRLAAFDIRIYIRNFASVFWVLVYPVLLLLLFGSMYGNETLNGKGFLDSYIPALCAMNVLSVAVFTLNIQMATYRENGILRRFRAAPAPPWVVLASNGLQGVLFVLVAALEVVLVGSLRWKLTLDPMHLLLMTAALLFGCLSFFSLGFALSGLASTVKASSGLAMAVFFPMMFLSGIAMPISLMPASLQAVSKALPLTYLVDLLQGLWYGGPIPNLGLDLLVLGGFCLVSLFLAVRFFRWES